jgi:hypothetical protein
MSEVTQEDLQYLPYNDANLGRIFTRDCKANIKMFIQEFKESEFGSRLIAEGLATGEHLDQILEETQKRFGHDDVNMREFTATAKSLWMAGDLEPARPATPQAPAVKQLTASQKAWQEFRIFTDSHSVQECKNRARVDEAYRKFLNTNLQREMGGTPVGDAVVAIGTTAVRQDESIRRIEDLRAFADAYRRTSTAEVKRMSSPATNPLGHKQYSDLLDACIAAGLV